MSETSVPQLYSHTRYIWHKMAIRATVMLPLIVVRVTVNKLSEAIDDLYDWVDCTLPRTYVEEMVEFDKLSENEKKRIYKLEKQNNEIKERMMFQVQKIK